MLDVAHAHHPLDYRPSHSLTGINLFSKIEWDQKKEKSLRKNKTKKKKKMEVEKDKVEEREREREGKAWEAEGERS